MNLSLKEMIDGLVCYKAKKEGSGGICGADRKMGSSASLVCKINGIRFIFLQQFGIQFNYKKIFMILNEYFSIIENPSSTKICRDTIGWANGWDCQSKGYKKSQGCLKTGWTCDKYSKAVTSTTGHKQLAWCANNAPLSGFPGQFGKANNYPEKNCCICGKPKGNDVGESYS